MFALRRLILAVLLLASSGSLLVWAANFYGDAGEPAKVLKVGLYENFPKVYTNAQGKPAGLFVELLNGVARQEAWRVEYVPCQWQGCLEALQAGELDLMPDVAFSVERAQRFDFHSVSVANSWSQVYTRPDLVAMSLLDLANQRVALLQGGIYSAALF